MAVGKYLFTSESVSMGHPDKLADQISDGILDALLRQDPTSRVACETLVTTGLAMIAGEITTKANADYAAEVRHVIREVGYTDDQMGINADTCAVMVSIDKQSPDIAQGVNEDSSHGKEIGAGDQGLMFGYACNDTPELMPLPIALAHRILNRLTDARQKQEVSWLRPDSKSQVTIEFEDQRPVRIDTVVVSTQHHPDVSNCRNSQLRHRQDRQAAAAQGFDQRRHQVPHQSHRAIRGGRTARRLRADGPEDHRRHLRRLGPSRRRRVQRQGSHQGGSQRGLHGPPRGQEHRGRRSWPSGAKCSWPMPLASPIR